MAKSKGDAPAAPTRESEAPDPERLLKQYDRLDTTWQTYAPLLQEIAEYVTPDKATITVTSTAGSERTQYAYDSTPGVAAKRLAANMAGSLTSPAIRWFSLRSRQQSLNDLTQVSAWLQEVEERVYLALRQSNFTAESNAMYWDLASLATGCLLVEERPKKGAGFAGFRFKAIALGHFRIAENWEGEVDTLHRKFKMTLRQMAQQFGLDKLPAARQEQYLQNTELEVEVLHAVYPRRVDNPKRKDAQHMAWASCYVDCEQKAILDEGGYDEFPYVVPRWDKLSEEIYGRGCSHLALPDIRTLNAAVEKVLRAADKAIDPPGLVSSDATLAELDMRAGSQNSVDGDPGKAWVPLETGSKFDVGQVLKEELRAHVRQTFFWDQLELGNDRLMTATEVERRLELMRRVLGPTLGRLESEFLTPLLARCVALMFRAQALPKAPDEMKGQEIDIEYEGPLARSQKASRVAAFAEVVNIAMPIAQLQIAMGRTATVLDNMNLDEGVRDIMEVTGLPSDYLTDPEDMEAERAERKQAQAQQMQLAQAEKIATAAGRAAPALKELGGMGAVPKVA